MAERIEESIAARGVVEKDGDRPDKPGEAVGAASPVEMESASFERAPSADGRRPADKAEDGAGGGALGADNLGESAGGVYNPRRSRSSTVQGAGAVGLGVLHRDDGRDRGERHGSGSTRSMAADKYMLQKR